MKYVVWALGAGSEHPGGYRVFDYDQNYRQKYGNLPH